MDVSYQCVIFVVMRLIENLTDYLLLDSGAVIERDTQDVVQLTHKGNYKLLTDETVHLYTKGYAVRLWRRFTPDDIVKMYKSNSSYPANLDDVVTSAPVAGQVECTGGTSAQVETAQVCTGDESAQVVAGKSAQVRINEVVYRSISDAAAQLSINRRTIKKRLDDESNLAYTYMG